MMKNYHNLSWHGQKLPTNPIGSTNFFALRSVWKSSFVFSLFFTLFLIPEISAQASFYTFAQSNETYSPITGGTVVTTSTDGAPNLDSYLSESITIPGFTFAGTEYTAMYVSANGRIALGSTAPSAYTNTVLSSSTGGNVFIAPLSGDLDDNTGVSEIRYETIGDELIVQWTNFKRYGRTETINFQARLNTVTGVIKFVYDGTPPYDTSTSYQPQVGIKSAAGFYSAITVGAAGNWNSPNVITSGITASSVATFSGNVGPTSGLTYTWTPGVPPLPSCATAFVPADLATDIERNPTLTWTAGDANATSYDVYFGSSANPALVGNQAGTSYVPELLDANTTYYWKVVPKNVTGEAIGCIERSFTTGSSVVYCVPSSTSSSTYIDNFSTSLGSTNISNTSSGYTTGGYQDNYASTAVTSIPTASFEFDMTVVGGTLGAAIWVDWNLNGTFEIAERVFVTTGYSSGPFSGSIEVPAGTPVGDYRMRVMVDWNSSVPSNPCMTANARTETEDYKITVLAQDACSGTPGAATIISSVPSICISGSAVLTATPATSFDSGFTYQWYNSAGAIAGETGTTLTTPVLTASESYYFETTCTNSGLSATSNTIELEVNNPEVLSTTAGSRCGIGSVELAATASTGASLEWYAEATGGESIGFGETFTTPEISNTTVFYVSANIGGSTESAGKPSSTGASGSYIGNSTGIVFTANSPLTLASTTIYPTGTGTVTIGLYDNTGVELMATEAIPVTGSGISTPVSVPLNFQVPIGTGYRLLLKAYTGITGLIRDSSGNTFPYTSTNVSVTDGYISGTSATYYYFYDIQVVTGCTSDRTAVTATVDTPPALTLSGTSASICAGSGTEVVTITAGASDYDTYIWSPATGVTGDAASGFVFDPIETTTYTLSASQSAGQLCTAEVTYTVNVNEVPSALTIVTDSATVCAGEVQALTANGGTIGSSGSITIGTDTTVTVQNGIEPTAFNNRYEHYWMQMVFTQEELNAAGIQAGSITGIKFNITTIGSATFVSDYRVKLGPTTADVLTGFIPTGLTEVFSAATYSQTLGVNSIEFDTEYVWDGTSNIILDIRSTGADSTNNSSTYYTATATNQTVTARTSSSFVSSDAYAASNPAGTLSLKRLNTTFDFNSSVATDIVWSPTTDLYTDAAATVPYTGTPASTVYVKSETVGSQTYTATATAPSTGCSTSGETTITTTEATAAPTADAQLFCGDATVLDLEAVGTDLQWYNDLTGGTALSDTDPLETGDYYVSQTLNGCESIRTLVVVAVNALPTATITRDVNTLTVSEENATYQWIVCDGSSTPIDGATGQSYTATEVGSYAVIVTLNGCEVTSECFDVSTLSNNAFDYANLGYYPNPVSDVLTIKHSETITGIQLYDIAGRLVKQMSNDDNEVRVDMAGMPAAFYIVKVTMENTSGEFKVIKK